MNQYENCRICEKHIENPFYYFKDNDYFKKGCLICSDCYKRIKIIDEINKCFTITKNNNIIDKETSLFFRQSLNNWKNCSFAMVKFIHTSNKKEINTAHHHYKKYYDILFNCLKYLKLDKKIFKEYTKGDIDNIKYLLESMHWYYGSGYPMTEQHHHLYHEKYGKDIVSEDLLIEFYKTIDKQHRIDCEKIIGIIRSNRKRKKELLRNILNNKYQFFNNQEEFKNFRKEERREFMRTRKI